MGHAVPISSGSALGGNSLSGGAISVGLFTGGAVFYTAVRSHCSRPPTVPGPAPSMLVRVHDNIRRHSHQTLSVLRTSHSKHSVGEKVLESCCLVVPVPMSPLWVCGCGCSLCDQPCLRCIHNRHPTAAQVGSLCRPLKRLTNEVR
jgi:hypothetical protein